MTHQLDTEKLAREAGIDDAAQLTPYILQRLAVFQGLVLEEAAKAFSDHSKEGREWVRGSLWDTLTKEGCARIRALAGGVR